MPWMQGILATTQATRLHQRHLQWVTMQPVSGLQQGLQDAVLQMLLQKHSRRLDEVVRARPMHRRQQGSLQVPQWLRQKAL